MIYKRKKGKKMKKEKNFKKAFQGHSSWLWSLPLWMELDQCSVMFSSLRELLSMFWLMELDFISLKGSAVSRSRF